MAEGMSRLYLDGREVAVGSVEFEQVGSRDDALVSALVADLAPLREAFVTFAVDVNAFAAAFTELFRDLGGDEARGLTWSELMAEIDRELEAG